MQRIRIRTVGRTVLGTWLAAGLLSLGYGLMVSGCAPATPVVEPLPVGEIDSLDKAEQAWRAARVAEHEPIWDEESGPQGDPFSAGLAAWHLASATHDPTWSGAAIDAFDEVLEGAPDFPLARAWRGSAHALAARDFPVQGLWQIVPGPGFARLYHVRAAFSDLDAAVEATPQDPVVRLLRGASYLGMPAIFGGRDEGLVDFDVLRGWTGDPSSNPDHEEVLRSRGWSEQYLLARALAMARVGEEEDAAESWTRLAETTDDPILRELARWHLISIDASR